MLKYALAHPGKIGDFLYCLPTAKALHERDGALIDMYTSEFCRAAKDLVKYQPYINDFIIPKDYVIDNAGQGVQPWKMDIPEGYDKVFQLGFEFFPQGPLHTFIAKRAGLSTVEFPTYKHPGVIFYNEPYVVVAYCKSRSYPRLQEAYVDFMNMCPIKCVQIGLEDELLPGTKADIKRDLNLLDTASLIANASAFVGFYSSPLVIANGFPGLPKIVTMWPGVGEQHGLHVPITIDLVHPTGEQILNTVMENLKK
jgi:hypothetical protein